MENAELCLRDGAAVYVLLVYCSIYIVFNGESKVIILLHNLKKAHRNASGSFMFPICSFYLLISHFRLFGS